MAQEHGLAEILDDYHACLAEIIKGNPRSYSEMYSAAEDATLANPFGPPARGGAEIALALERAASVYREGQMVSVETFARYETAELAYLLEIERFEAKVGGQDHLSDVSLRTTTIFRREGGQWRIVHRHADPITSIQAPESVIRT